MTHPISGILLQQETILRIPLFTKTFTTLLRNSPTCHLGERPGWVETMEMTPPLLPWRLYVLTFFLILLITPKPGHLSLCISQLNSPPSSYSILSCLSLIKSFRKTKVLTILNYVKVRSFNNQPK